MLKRGFGIISRIKQIQRTNQRFLGVATNQNASFLSTSNSTGTRTHSNSTKIMSMDLVHSVLQEQGAEDICCIKVPKVGFLASDWFVDHECVGVSIIIYKLKRLSKRSASLGQ